MSQASSRTPRTHLANIDDLMAIPEEERWHEILDGLIVEKAAPSGEHGLGQMAVAQGLTGFSCRPGRPGRPGGWWLATEPSIELAPHQVVQPDLAGWRRDRVPKAPREYPVTIRPDWVCEIGTDGNSRRRDGITKRRIYADHGVPYYWLLDTERSVLVVLRLVAKGYQEILEADRSQVVRAEPFESIELSIADLFGVD